MSSSAISGRKVGLSKKDRPPQLLRSVDRNTVTKPASTTKKRSRALEREVDVSAPPMSSDEEGSSEKGEPEELIGAVKGVKSPFSSGDESDEPDRADIHPTTFPSSLNSTTSTSSNRSKRQYGGARSGLKSHGSARSSQESKPSSSQRSQNTRETAEGLGPVKGETLLRDPDRKFKGALKPRPSSPRAPRPKRPKKAVDEPPRPSTPVKIKMPDDFLLSPETRAKGSSTLDLSAKGADTPSPEKPLRTLRVLSKSPSGPAAEINLNMRFLDRSDDSGPEPKRQKPANIALVDRPAQPPRKMTDSLKKGSALSKPKSAPTATRIDLSFDGDDSSLSELSSDDNLAGGKADNAQCPYCQKPVDADSLQAFSKGAYMTLHKQRRFCTQHKEDEARVEWKTRGYPDIDWARLDARISSHHDYLEGVLRGKQCYYGDLLAQAVKAGEKRNLAKADFNSTPGYYGERGFRAMQEGIFARFSSLLRKRAVEDGLVAARGYSLYVQAVLVPELAVRLVMEDMEVGEEGAREILKGSTWVGDLLCEDEGDVVDENDENLF